MRRTILIFAAAIAAAFGMRGQVTTQPAPLQESSKDVEIYFHADQGNKGLIDMPQDSHIYAHTGVLVEDANGTQTDWKYAPSWDEDLPKYRLEYVSANLWKLHIGDIRTYYGVASGETVKKLCFVFRTTGGTRQGKGPGDSDIYVDVVDSGLQLMLAKDYEGTVITGPTKVTFTAYTTEPATIELAVNGTPIASRSNTTSLEAPYDFDTTGNYTVKATATAGGKTLEDTMEMIYVRASAPAADQTLPASGVTVNGDGSRTFCIAAPQKSGAMLMGSWNGYTADNDNVMDYIDRDIEGVPFRYFTVTLPAETTGDEFGYYYLIDGTTAVGDPYARLVLDPYNDKYIAASVYPDMPQYPEGLVPANTVVSWYADNLLDYDWQVKSFKGATKENLVIYEMLFRDFTGTEGKALGNGTVRQAIDKLEYIRNLGVNAVELLPINEFNGNESWGYNPNFYFAVDKAYGTPQDYKEFIDRCHRLGIAVILDVVLNQSDGLHPWYQMYGGIQNSPFYNSEYNGVNGAPHAYSVLNDWNQGYPLVQEQWKDMLQFWLTEYKVDGFRFDLVKGLGDNTSYKDAGMPATDDYNASRVARMKTLHDAMREVNPNAYFINENLAGAKEENEMAEDGEINWANVNFQGCEYAKGNKSNSSLDRMWAVKDGRTAGSTVAYLESHDEERLAYAVKNAGVQGVKNNHTAAMQRCGSAASQMILTPGSHMIWMFSEMGNSQTTKTSSGNNTSPKIVNWELLDEPANYGLMTNYSELINIRLGNQELFADNGNYSMSYSAWETGRYANATGNGKEIHLVVNPNTDREISMPVSFLTTDNANYHIASKSYGSEPAFDVIKGRVTVPANCYAVVTTTDITGVETVKDDESDNTRIYAIRGAIAVSGTQGNVEVFAADGTKVAEATGDATIAVSAGLYVVRAGKKSAKVLVN